MVDEYLDAFSVVIKRIEGLQKDFINVTGDPTGGAAQAAPQ